MAFCEITKNDYIAFLRIVKKEIQEDLTQVSDFEQFAKKINSILLEKKASQEKALGMLKYLPAAISDYLNASPKYRDSFRKGGISIDKIYDLEDKYFKDIDNLVAFIKLAPTNPIKLISEEQQTSLNKLDEHLSKTKVKIKNDKREINGTPINNRVTTIAKAGYGESIFEGENDAPALMHGNTIDEIAKSIFNGSDLQKPEGISEESFSFIVSEFQKIKKMYEDKGFLFRAGVTLYNTNLDIAGEADLIGIDSNGTFYIFDFKTTRSIFSKEYLESNILFKDNDGTALTKLSNASYFSTQGYIYGKLLEEQLGGKVKEGVKIIGVGLVYDESDSNSPISKISKVSVIEMNNVRDEYKGKTLSDIKSEYERLNKIDITEVLEVPKKVTRRQVKDFNTNRKELPRVALSSEIPMDDQQLLNEVRWLEETFGEDIAINISNIVNSGLFGKFSLDAITLYKNASIGTGYHEGWHRFSQVFLTKEQKEKLYSEIKSKNISFLSRDGRSLNTQTARNIDIEEYLADEFAKYAQNPKAYNNPSISKKTKNFFERLWNWLKRQFSGDTTIDLFEKLYKGRISEYTPSVNNAFWGNLNSLVLNKNGDEIIPNDRVPLYVETIKGLIMSQLKERGRSITSLKEFKELQKAISDNLKHELNLKLKEINSISDEEFDKNPIMYNQQLYELERIQMNWTDFLNSMLELSEINSFKKISISDDLSNLSEEQVKMIDDYQNDDEFDLEDDEVSKPDLFDRAGNEVAAIEAAEGVIRDLFSMIPKVKDVKRINGETIYTYHLNELGYPILSSHYDSFYKTKKFLSGKFNMDDMVSTLTSPNNLRKFPELKYIYEFIKPFLSDNGENNRSRNIENALFVQSFWQALVLPEIGNYELTRNYKALKKNKLTKKNTTVFYRKAIRNMSAKIIKSWEKNFKDKRGKKYLDFNKLATDNKDFFKSPLYMTSDGKMLLNPFLDYANMFDKNDMNSLNKFFEMMGIQLNEKVLYDSEATNKMKEIFYDFTNNITKFADHIKYEAQDKLEEFILHQVKLSKDQISNLLTFEDYLEYADDLALDEIARMFFIDNPIQEFKKLRTYRSVDSKGKDIKIDTYNLEFDFERLAEFEEIYGDKISSGSFKVDGKTKYPYYNTFQMAMSTSLMNGLRNVSDFANEKFLSHLDPAKNPWMNRSLIMQTMFNLDGSRAIDNKNGKPIELEIHDISNTKDITEDGFVERHPRRLNKQDKFFMDVLTLFVGGRIEIPRAETSSTFLSIGLNSYGQGKLIPISNSEMSDNAGFPPSMKKILTNYLLSEIEKRQWFIKNEPKNWRANRLNIFEGILSEDLKNEITNNIQSESNDILTKEFNGGTIQGKFFDEVKKYFDDRAKENEQFFNGLTKDQQDMIKDTLQTRIQSFSTVAKTFTINKFIMDYEYNMLFFGDMYNYSNPFKRGKYITNTGAPYFIDATRNWMLNKVQFQTLSSIFTGIKPTNKDFTILKSGVINDIQMDSAYVNKDDSKNIMLQDIIASREMQGLLDRSNKKEFDKEVNKIKERIKKYDEVNMADGQGIIGLDFYRSFSIITKIWSEEKENEYNRQKAILRLNYNLYHKMEDDNLVRMSEEEEYMLRKSDMALSTRKPYAYFNPLKLSYTGPQVKDGPFTPVFDKFSVRPIIPESSFGRRDEELLKEMLKKDIDYLKFESGSKMFDSKVDKGIDWMKKISTGQYKMDDHSVDIGEDPQLLYSAYLKHQLSTEGHKEDGILGSQFRKIVFGIRYIPFVRNSTTLTKYFDELRNSFLSNIRDLIDIEEKDMLSVLGITMNKDGTYSITNKEKFIELINKESGRRGIPINNIDYVQYDKATGQPKYDLDFAFNRSQITDLLSGMLDERLRRLKVNGSPLYQVSSIGSENKGMKFSKPTAEDIRKYGTAGLHYYHLKYDGKGNPIKTSTMGVKIALTKEYEGLFELQAPQSLGGGKIKTNNYIESLSRLNQAMADEKWKELNRDKFILIGYRIPTQNTSFIDHMEVMEFLPASAGAIIIAPMELIIKSGSDFDIDKMSIMRVSLTKGGNIQTPPAESIDEINKKIIEGSISEKEYKILKNQLEEAINEEDSYISGLIKSQRKLRMSIMDMASRLEMDELSDRIMFNILNDKKLTEFESSSLSYTRELNEGRPIYTPKEQEFEENMSVTDFDIFKRMMEMIKTDGIIESHKELHSHYQKSKIENNISGEWFEKRRAYKNSKNNNIVNTLSKLISHPLYYELLITPSTTQDFEDITNKLIIAQSNLSEEQAEAELKKNRYKLFDRKNTAEENSRYTTQLTTFDNFINKGNDLGSFAIQRTFADNFNDIKLSLAKVWELANGTTKVIFTPLIPISERHKRVKEGRILMYGESVGGMPIKDAFDQSISATVDLAGNPFYAYMGINVHNKRAYSYLVHMGVNIEDIVLFLNQPILMKLYKLADDKKRSVPGYTLKHAMVELGISNEYKILKNEPRWPGSRRMKYDIYEKYWQPAIYEGDEKIEDGKYIPTGRADKSLKRPYVEFNYYLDENDEFLAKDLEEAIRLDAATKGGMTRTDLQKKVLAYFASMVDESDAITKLEFAYNTDTTKYATLVSIIRNRNNKQAVADMSLFDSHQLEKLQKDTMIAPFDYTDKAYQIHKSIFPKLYNDDNIKLFVKLALDVWGAKNIELEKISKMIENDYIEFIYKNFGTYNGKNISDEFLPTIINMDPENHQHEFFSFKLADIKRKYPELEEIPFVSNLTEDVHFPEAEDKKNSYMEMDNREIRNIFFIRHPDNPIAERDIFTSNWRNLINFNPDKFNLKRTYTNDQVREISTFFRDLVYFSLVQSGLTNNSNGFSDLIPYEIWGRFITNAFNNMQKSIDADGHLLKQMNQIFEQRVKQMNPNVKWGSTTILLDERDDEGRPIPEQLMMYANYYRGKDYKFTLSQLGKLAELYSDEDDIDDIDETDTSFNLTPGQYVLYNGQEWIVTKWIDKYKSWKIYNPLLRGKNAVQAIPSNRVASLIDKKASIAKLATKEYLITNDKRIIDLSENKPINPSKSFKESIMAAIDKNDDNSPKPSC